MNDKKVLGKRGEELATEFLEKEDYEILDRNFSCAFGEVDIIGYKDGEIIFVEVKTRTQDFFGMPAEAVNWVKRRHLYKVAEAYLYRNNLFDLPISFDVIEVFLFEDDYRIAHIKNAIIENPRFTYGK